MASLAQRHGPVHRTPRQIWALPGSRHDKLVAFLSFVLPVAVGVLAAFLVMAPLYAGGDVSFVLDKTKVAVAHERMRTQAAQYRGQDTKGQPFTLDAGSAVQHSSADPVIELRTLAAHLALPDGPAQVTADSGRYDMTAQQVHVDGPVLVTGPAGYRLNTRDAVLDLKGRKLASGGAVDGTVRQGSFTANRMHADLAQRTVTLDGNARLRIRPGGSR